MKSKKTDSDVIEHWYQLVSAENFSTKEVYDLIEGEIAAQKVPGLTISRVDLSEGGILSDNRQYLRMRRERLVFDVCAAPVGVNYFFSYRYYQESVDLTLAEIISLLVIFGIIGTIFQQMGGWTGLFIFLGILFFAFFLMKNVVSMGLRDLDASLVNSEVVGKIYLRYFRKDTYYRQDLRIAYGSIVAGIVKGEVGAVMAEKGVRLVREYSYSPILGGLYASADRVPEAKQPKPEKTEG